MEIQGSRPSRPPRNALRALHSPTASGSLLSDFVKTSRHWSAEGILVPRRLRWSLWALIPLELLWVIRLATIVTGIASCRGPICTVATLDHHAAVLLACAVSCLIALAGLIPTTRGFAKCNGIEITGLAIASAAGGVALLGVAVLVIGALIVLIVIATFLLAFTATSRREPDDARPRTPSPIAVPRDGDGTRARRAEPAS
jgi:hypothetical protein